MLRALASVSGVLLMASGALAAPMDHRPKNFFSVVWQKDRAVCGAVLTSLNEEYRLPPDLYRWTNPNLMTDLLLTSDLEVEWQRMPLETWELDYTSVDLANDGHEIPVLRWAFADHMSGYNNILFLPPALPEEIASGQSLKDDIIRKLSGDRLRIQRGSSDFWTWDNYPVNGTFDFTIIKHGNRFFLLGAASLDAQRTTINEGGFDAFVMAFHTQQDIPVICHFHGGTQHAR
jgi:hypothetical protein